MTPEELLEQQRRLGIALTAADRAARTAPEPSGADAMPVADPSLRAAAAPLANDRPFAMPDVTTLRTRATAADDFAGEAPGFVPAGYVLNPEATNFGRLSTPRTDVPRFVPADRVPQGLSPLQERAMFGGIDVRSYTGSRYAGNTDPRGITPGQPATATTGMAAAAAPGATMAPAPASLLPVGNLQARDAILRAEFPRASRAELTALGNLSYYRPGVFNSAMAGTRLDPTLVAQRAETARIQSTEADRRMAQYEQDQLARGATQNYFSQYGSESLASAARMGADAGTLTTLAGQERAREQYDFDVEQARERAARFDDPLRPITLFGGPAFYNRATGNVMTPDRQPTPAVTNLAKLLTERAQAQAAGDSARVAIYDQAIENETKPNLSSTEAFMIMAGKDPSMLRARAGAPKPTPTAAATPPAAATAPAPAPAPAPKPAAVSAVPAKPAQAPQQFKAGQRARQGDKVYQFNGTTWVEIK